LSVSTFNVVSFSQVMCSRVGMRITPAAPNARHDPSFEVSHVSATLRPSGLIGTLA
jgi:hypothetical protein